jgi:hypothetical protein
MSLTPDSFNKLGSGLHQDVDLCATEGLAVYCLGFLTSQDQAELTPYLRTVLATSAGGEIKGLLNRTPADRRFSTKAAREFLQEVLDELEQRQRV